MPEASQSSHRRTCVFPPPCASWLIARIPLRTRGRWAERSQSAWATDRADESLLAETPGAVYPQHLSRSACLRFSQIVGYGSSLNSAIGMVEVPSEVVPPRFSSFVERLLCRTSRLRLVLAALWPSLPLARGDSAFAFDVTAFCPATVSRWDCVDSLVVLSEEAIRVSHRMS